MYKQELAQREFSSIKGDSSGSNLGAKPGTFRYIYHTKLGKVTFTPLDPDPDLRWRRNPLLCGMNYLKLTASLEVGGIACCNRSRHVISAANLYNDLKEAGRLLAGMWPEMERLIEIHTHGLFRGQKPMAPQECYSRMLQSQGASIMHWCKTDPGRARHLPACVKRIKSYGVDLCPKRAVQLIHNMFQRTGRSAIRCAFGFEKDVLPRQISPKRTLIQYLTDMKSWFSAFYHHDETIQDYLTINYKRRQLLLEIDHGIRKSEDVLPGYEKEKTIFFSGSVTEVILRPLVGHKLQASRISIIPSAAAERQGKRRRHVDMTAVHSKIILAKDKRGGYG